MEPQWLQYCIGLLVAGNLWFLQRVIQRSDRNHDATLTVEVQVQHLAKAIAVISKKVDRFERVREDVRVLKHEVFGERVQPNGHDPDA